MCLLSDFSKTGIRLFLMQKKYEFRIIIGRYDVSVAKKIDQSESVNKPLTKTGTGTNEH